MDTSIRRIAAAASAAPTRATLSVPTRPMSIAFVTGAVDAIPDLGNRRFAVLDPVPATVASLRKAILDCAHQATTTEPVDTDARLHCFIAKLSGTMEGLGERELDAALWNLMTTHRQPTSDEQLGIDWWNGLTEERRAHWLAKAEYPTVAAAWALFRAAEDDLATEG
jgi:hypothetical protein